MSRTHIIYKEGDTLSILSVLIPCHKKGRVRFTFAFLVLYHYVKDRVRKKHSGEVENNGFEPLTPCLQSRCSSQLS